MRLEILIAFWKLHDMIQLDHHISQSLMPNGDGHFVDSITVKSPDKFAVILYRYEKTRGITRNIAFVHADIMLPGFPSFLVNTEVYIKNAKIKDLVQHLVKDLSPWGSVR